MQTPKPDRTGEAGFRSLSANCRDMRDARGLTSLVWRYRHRIGGEKAMMKALVHSFFGRSCVRNFRAATRLI